jgi:hypothetical protein
LTSGGALAQLRKQSVSVRGRPALSVAIVTQLASGVPVVTPVLGVKIGLAARRRRVTLVDEAVS